MSFEDYKFVVYRNQPDGWVAEIPAIAGCHALTPTAEEAVAELAAVFRLIEAEHRAIEQEVLNLLDEPPTRSSPLPRKSRRTQQTPLK
jgi:predicted RNase H-like HicB family nuclease